MPSVVWTIKVNKEMDKLVDELVRKLGYTSKAEFIREAVRDAILRKNIGLLGLFSMDKFQSVKDNPIKALERLANLRVDKKIVEEELNKESIPSEIYYKK